MAHNHAQWSDAKIPLSVGMATSSAIMSTVAAAVTGVLTSLNDWDTPYFNFMNNLQVIAWVAVFGLLILRRLKSRAAKLHRRTEKRFDEHLDEHLADMANQRAETMQEIKSMREELLAAVEQHRIGQYVALADQAEPHLRSVSVE